MGALYLLQQKLIYFPDVPVPRSEMQQPKNVENVPLIARDGTRVHGYLLNGIKPKTILLCHANAGNIAHRMPIAEELVRRLDCAVFLLSYRGYGHSEGSPSEKGIKEDIVAAIGYLGTLDTQVILYGQSLGGAVAIWGAYETGIEHIILENTFTSMIDMIKVVMPFFAPFSFLCTERWETEALIKRNAKTVLFLAGERDELVPPEQMRRLAAHCPGQQVVSFPRGTHNDTFMQKGYFDAIEQFVRKVQ